MPRTYYRGHLTDYAICRPQHLRLAVPGTPQTLPAIMANYALAWARASNAGYFAPATGLPEGIMADEGTRYPVAHVAGRPILIVWDGKARIVYSPAEIPIGCQMAIEAGPVIIEDGRIPDLTELLKQGQFRDWTALTVTTQRATGITADGRVIDAIMFNADMLTIAAFLLERGCVQAMKLDGGGSAGTIINDTGKVGPGVWNIGYRTRRMPGALVMTQTLSEVIATPQRTALLCPGHGGLDPGACGNGLIEAEITLDICQRVKSFLERAGVRCLLTRDGREGPSVADRIAMCNQAKPDAFVLVHVNSATSKDVNGIETFHWHKSTKGRALAQVLLDRTVAATGLARRLYAPKAVFQGVSGYYPGLRLTDPPAALIEVGFLSNVWDAAHLKDFSARMVVAQAIAVALGDWLG